MSHDLDAPQVVAKAANEVEAAIIVAALEAHGIEGKAVGVFASTFRAEAPGDVSIVVRQRDLARAQEALAELPK
jgi:hypothetical protein